MPLVKFIAPTDPRMLGTIEATRRLLVSDSLVYRYDPDCAASDGLHGDEGAFSLCTFWWVEALTRAGLGRVEILKDVDYLAAAGAKSIPEDLRSGLAGLGIVVDDLAGVVRSVTYRAIREP